MNRSQKFEEISNKITEIVNRAEEEIIFLLREKKINCLGHTVEVTTEDNISTIALALGGIRILAEKYHIHSFLWREREKKQENK